MNIAYSYDILNSKIEKPSAEKIPTKCNRSMNIPTLQHFINTTFEEQLAYFQKSGTQLQKADTILAKMKGYDPWPARIIEYSKNMKSIKCFFFGTHEIGSVGSKQIIPFADAFQTVRLVCLRNIALTQHFVKGIQEIEIECGVPKQLSCLREYEAIE